MVELAVQNYDLVRCSKWETEQSEWIRTRGALDEYKNQIAQMIKTGNGPEWLPTIDIGKDEDQPRILLVCGADLMETFSVPGLWEENDVRIRCQIFFFCSVIKSSYIFFQIISIVRDYGLVVITREGSNPEKYVYDHDILHQYKVIPTQSLLNWISNNRYFYRRISTWLPKEYQTT